MISGRIGGFLAAAFSAGGLALGCTVTTADADADSGGAAGEGGSAMSGGTSSSGGSSGAGAEAGGSAGTGGSSGGGGSSGTGGSVTDAVGDILNDPAVTSALEEASDQGIDIVTHTEEDAPDPSGYYSFALRAGAWVASGNGANVGFATAAAEMRVDLQADGSVDTASVSSFDGVTPGSYGTDSGYLLRGSGTEATLYGLRSFVCDLSGASYSVAQAYIWTGTFEEGTGDWLDQRQFLVTTSVDGELTSDCEEAMVGNTEVVGGWAVAEVTRASKVEAGELEFMCVDDGRGYVPLELWTGAGGEACECTTDFVVSCES